MIYRGAPLLFFFIYYLVYVCSLFFSSTAGTHRSTDTPRQRTLPISVRVPQNVLSNSVFCSCFPLYLKQSNQIQPPSLSYFFLFTFFPHSFPNSVLFSLLSYFRSFLTPSLISFFPHSFPTSVFLFPFFSHSFRIFVLSLLPSYFRPFLIPFLIPFFPHSLLNFVFSSLLP